MITGYKCIPKSSDEGAFNQFACREIADKNSILLLGGNKNDGEELHFVT